MTTFCPEKKPDSCCFAQFHVDFGSKNEWFLRNSNVFKIFFLFQNCKISPIRMNRVKRVNEGFSVYVIGFTSRVSLSLLMRTFVGIYK